jgi:drug/metabolite transporter (DMT)-like permease
MIETWPFLAVLASALLHAIWNAITRASSEPGDVMAAAVITAGLINVPGLLWFGLPASVSWPFLMSKTVLNTIAIRLAMAAYRQASFGFTYPTMRAGIPFLALPAGSLLLNEWPRPLGVIGVMLIASALIMLALAAKKISRPELRGFGFALLAGLAGAGCVMVDAIGVRRSGNVLGYAFAVAIANAAMIAMLTATEGRNPFAVLRRYAHIALGTSALSTTSFLLYIWAISVAPVALAAALRETSVLFAVAIAHFMLKEGVSAKHWTAASLALLGIIAIRLG